MTREEIILAVESQFPMTVELTTEMIQEGRKNTMDIEGCVGALLLKSVLENNEVLNKLPLAPIWAVSDGYLLINDPVLRTVRRRDSIGKVTAYHTEDGNKANKLMDMMYQAQMGKVYLTFERITVYGEDQY